MKNMKNMKNRLLLYICILATVHTGYVSAQNDTISYVEYIKGDILTANKAEAQQILDDSTDEIEKGLAYFRIALLNDKDESKVLAAYEYWTEMDASHPDNAVVLAYMGTLEAMYGGALKKNVMTKLKHAKNGIETLTQAVEGVMPTKNNLAISYVYFLRGQTHASLPKFFKEFKKETLNNLKSSKKYLDMAKKEGEYEDVLIANLYANIYTAYSQWYIKKKNNDKAMDYLNKALDQIKDYTPNRVIEINKIIKDIS